MSTPSAHPTPSPKIIHASGQKVPEHLSTASPAPTREEKIDQQMEDSFPASDPPSYSGGNHIVGTAASAQRIRVRIGTPVLAMTREL